MGSGEWGVRSEKGGPIEREVAWLGAFGENGDRHLEDSEPVPIILRTLQGGSVAWECFSHIPATRGINFTTTETKWGIF